MACARGLLPWQRSRSLRNDMSQPGSLLGGGAGVCATLMATARGGDIIGADTTFTCGSIAGRGGAVTILVFFGARNFVIGADGLFSPVGSETVAGAGGCTDG